MEEEIFLSVGAKCMLHHRDDRFYQAIAAIVMHNMMVEERVGNEERESENFYDVDDEQSIMASNEDEADSSNDSDLVTNTGGNYDPSSVTHTGWMLATHTSLDSRVMTGHQGRWAKQLMPYMTL